MRLGSVFESVIRSRRGPWITIVGILNNVKQWEWDKAADSEFYVPFSQDPTYRHDPASFATMTLVVKSTTNASALAPAIQQQIYAIDRDVAVPNILPMEEVTADAVWAPRASMTLMAALAGIAALLAAVGILGVVNYVVAARSQEIGIRVALGAAPAGIVRMVLAQAMRPVMAGAVVGVAAAIGLARLLSSLLYGVSPNDPLVLVGVTSMIIGIAWVAALVPARRAALTDPTVVLRGD